jgi:hypothetical protein
LPPGYPSDKNYTPSLRRSSPKSTRFAGLDFGIRGSCFAGLDFGVRGSRFAGLDFGIRGSC